MQCPTYMNLAKCVTFYHHLQQVQPCQPPDSTPLTQHMTLHSCNFLFSRLQGQLAQQLQEEIYQDRFHTSAEGTKASYCTHRTSYLRFCEHIGYPPLPAQSSFLSVCCLFSSQSRSLLFQITVILLVFYIKNLTCLIPSWTIRPYSLS